VILLGSKRKRKPKYSKEDIEKRIPQHIQMIGEYVDTNTKTLFKCTLDNHEWMAIPKHMYGGNGG
jgi:hypothetical protein